MKKEYISIFTFSILLASLTVANGQPGPGKALPKQGFGFKAGINYSTQYSPENKGAFETTRILGFTAGGFYHYFFTRTLGIQVELSGSGKGSHWKENFYAEDEKKDILTYFDLPLLVRYQPFEKINFHLGPQVSYLGRAMQYNYRDGIRYVVEDFYNRVDAGIVGGVEANLDNHVNITLRYGHGFISCYKKGGYNYDAYNSYLQLTAGFRFEKSTRIQSKSKSYKRQKRRL